ncbi:uncharacterized protein [Argopecten irradians]|uniref:uncharacterized protein n=1 Tax=Argopecten irradians TaxID=31199 RepID=UPI003715F339
MRKDNATLLQKYKHDIEMYEERLRQQIHECKSVLQNGSHIELYEIECEIDSKTHLPVKPTLRSASFSPNKNPRKHLEFALSNASVTSIDEKFSSTASHHKQPKVNREDAVARNKLLTDTMVVGDFWSPYGIRCICPITDDRTWVSYNYSVTLNLLDRKGTAKQKVTHNAVIRDVSISPTTHRLWACDEERTILELVSGQFTEMFTTKDAPECLCVSATDHIIVGSSKHVSRYNKQGQTVNTMVATVTGKPIVCTPWKITECPITNNVAVIDNSDESDGGDGNKLVCVMDVDFQELFVYRGDVPSVSIHTQPVEGTVFDPRDIVYDRQGNIIIADWISCSIVLLDGVGESLKILHMDKNLPWAVGIGTQSVLWSVFGTYSRGYNVKLLQYSSKT